MKLRKQTGLKAALVAGAAGLMLAFFSLVRSNPPPGDAAQNPAVPTEYDDFFAPNRSTQPEPVAPAAPRARTRAS